MASRLLDIKIEGQPRIEGILRSLEGGEVLTDILDESAAVLFNRMRTRFLQQVDPDGVPWVPSKASQKRAKSGRGGGTLFDTGDLFHSIQLYQTGSDSRAIGTDVPYGIYAQDGTRRTPKREFLGFGVQDVEYTERVALRRIAEALA